MKCNQDCEQGRRCDCDEDMYSIEVWMAWAAGICLTMLLTAGWWLLVGDVRMSIHTLHDLCYAYGVADPVREMLFALQDRITELEAQRQPLSDEQLDDISVVARKGNLHDLRIAIEAAHGIKEGT